MFGQPDGESEAVPQAAGLFECWDGHAAGWVSVPWVSPRDRDDPDATEERREARESGWVLVLRQTHSVPPTRGPSSPVGPCPPSCLLTRFPLLLSHFLLALALGHAGVIGLRSPDFTHSSPGDILSLRTV